MLKRMSPWMSRSLLVAVVCSCFASGPLSRSASADDLTDSALSIAPHDVAFFSTSVNLDDAWEDFANSRLVTRLRNVPYVQKLESELVSQWENPEGQVVQAKAMLENPSIKNALRMLQDMFSDEVFVYGEDNWSDAIVGFMELNNKVTTQIAQNPEAVEEYFNSHLAGDLAELAIPTTVMGFRLDDPDNAMFQLNAIEAIVRMGGSQVPQLAPVLERFVHTNFDGGMALALTLDASLIPLDELSGNEREMAEKVQQALNSRSITLAIGIKDGILLMAMGEGESVIDQIGQANKTLLGEPTLSVLKEAAPERLRAVSYSSANFRNSAWKASYGNYFSRLSVQATSAIRSEADENPKMEAWLQEIEADAKRMDAFVLDTAPMYGPTLGWQVATETGAEGFLYDWTKSQMFQNATPLEIVNNSGAQPLVMIAFKQAPDQAASLEAAEFLLEAIPGHIRKFIEIAAPSDEKRDEAREVFDRSWPLVLETVEILQDKIAPSLDARETLFAFAAQWMTQDLGPGAPPLPQPVPLPELALACKLTHQDLFLSGCADLYGVVDKVVALIRDLNPGFPADYVVPRPQQESIQGGKRFFYSEFAEAVPLEGFNPQVAVNQDVVVVGFSQRQVDDMLDSRPTRTQPAWISPQTPVAAVAVVDMAGMTAAIRPWAKIGMLMSVGDLDTPLSPAPVPVPTGNDVLAMWDCLTSLGKVMSSSNVGEQRCETRWVWIEQ